MVFGGVFEWSSGGFGDSSWFFTAALPGLSRSLFFVTKLYLFIWFQAWAFSFPMKKYSFKGSLGVCGVLPGLFWGVSRKNVTIAQTS